MEFNNLNYIIINFALNVLSAPLLLISNLKILSILAHLFLSWNWIIFGLWIMTILILNLEHDIPEDDSDDKPEDDSKESTEDKTEGDSDNKNNENK